MASFIKKLFGKSETLYGKPDKIDRGTIDLVNKNGWTVMYVVATDADPEHTPDFAYTINLDEFCGLPELIVFGVPQSAVNDLFSALIEKAQNGWKWAGPEQTISGVLGDNAPIILKTVHPSNYAEHMGMSTNYRRLTGKPALKEVVQIFWPDKQNDFPWDWGDESWRQPELNKPLATAGETLQ